MKLKLPISTHGRKPSISVRKPGDPGYEQLRGELHGYRAGKYLNREKTLLLQYTKLANYFTLELCDAWGGNFWRHGSTWRMHEGSKNFLTDVAKLVKTGDQRFVSRVNEYLPWGPDNIVLTDTPSTELGVYWDPYLSCRGSLIPIITASQFLQISVSELIELKLQLLMDPRVTRECLIRMLRPRPDWSEATFRSGQHSRS